MVRYFGPGHTGTVETIFRLAADRNPGRWDWSTIPAPERKVWDEIRDGSRSLEYTNLDQVLTIEVPKPHDSDMVERRCDIMDACDTLRASLDIGAISANYRDENGVRHAVPVEFWRGDDECVITALLTGYEHLDVESNDESIPYRLLRLPVFELGKAWPTLVAPPLREWTGNETASNPVEALSLAATKRGLETDAPGNIPSLNDRKRRAVDAAIDRLGIDELARMHQKERETAVINFVKAAGNDATMTEGATVSDRYVRTRFRKAKERRHSQLS
jgi:hypothetical protein